MYTSWDCIARTHGYVQNDSETHSTGVTRLHSRLRRSFNPVTQSLAFNTYIFCTNGIEMARLLVDEFNTKSYSQWHIFQIRNLFHCVAESWWNMPFKGTRLGNGVTDDAVAKLLRLSQHASALWRHAVWIRIVTSHNAWMDYEYSLFIIMIHTSSKQWVVCIKGSFII